MKETQSLYCPGGLLDKSRIEKEMFQCTSLEYPLIAISYL